MAPSGSGRQALTVILLKAFTPPHLPFLHSSPLPQPSHALPSLFGHRGGHLRQSESLLCPQDLVQCPAPREHPIAVCWTKKPKVACVVSQPHLLPHLEDAQVTILRP